MKTKIFGLFILTIFSLSMVTGAFATDKCVPNLEKEKLNVKVNGLFGMGLSSNPSTGYKWICEYNPEYIQLTEDQYIPDEPQLPGSGGAQMYGFKALKAGKTQIVLKYLRPWENCLPEKTIIYDIKITK